MSKHKEKMFGNPNPYMRIYSMQDKKSSYISAKQRAVITKYMTKVNYCTGKTSPCQSFIKSTNPKVTEDEFPKKLDYNHSLQQRLKQANQIKTAQRSSNRIAFSNSRSPGTDYRSTWNAATHYTNKEAFRSTASTRRANKQND